MREQYIDKNGPLPDQRRACYKGLGRCWQWTGPICTRGYGLTLSHVTHRTERAHRVSWEHHNGKIPEGAHICHHCDNTGCVNPQHLFLGNAKKNMEDCSAKGRKSRTKITRRDFERMFTLNNRGMSRKDISAALGISQAVVTGSLLKVIRVQETKGLVALSHRTTISEKERMAIFSLHTAGKTNKEISTELRVKYSRVCWLLRGRANRTLREKKVKIPRIRVSSPGSPRITPADVVEIRRLREEGASRVEIGKRYGLRPATIGLITQRKVWQHVE